MWIAPEAIEEFIAALVALTEVEPRTEGVAS